MQDDNAAAKTCDVDVEALQEVDRKEACAKYIVDEQSSTKILTSVLCVGYTRMKLILAHPVDE